MISHSKLILLKRTELESLLAKNNIYQPKGMIDESLIDFCTSRLHGIEFIHIDEQIKDGKIIQILQKPKPPVPGEKCPHCSNAELRFYNVPKDTAYYGFKQCGFCGIVLTPEEIKKLGANTK